MNGVTAAAHLLFPFAHRRARWAAWQRELDRYNTLDEFNAWVEREQPHPFVDYRHRQMSLPTLQVPFRETVDRLGIDLAGRSLLDIGPGLGEGLDLAGERGAKALGFVELDPVFYTYARLRHPEADAHRFNHVLSLGRIRRQFDVVWARGAVVVDQMVASPRLLRRWLRMVDEVTVPGGVRLLTPFWTRRVPLDGPFTAIMREAGYEVVEPPAWRDDVKAYPFVFAK